MGELVLEVISSSNTQSRNKKCENEVMSTLSKSKKLIRQKDMYNMGLNCIDSLLKGIDYVRSSIETDMDSIGLTNKF